MNLLRKKIKVDIFNRSLNVQGFFSIKDRGCKVYFNFIKIKSFIVFAVAAYDIIL